MIEEIQTHMKATWRVTRVWKLFQCYAGHQMTNETKEKTREFQLRATAIGCRCQELNPATFQAHYVVTNKLENFSKKRLSF